MKHKARDSQMDRTKTYISQSARLRRRGQDWPCQSGREGSSLLLYVDLSSRKGQGMEPYPISIPYHISIPLISWMRPQELWRRGWDKVTFSNTVGTHCYAPVFIYPHLADSASDDKEERGKRKIIKLYFGLVRC